jgi:hypothetical protein
MRGYSGGWTSKPADWAAAFGRDVVGTPCGRATHIVLLPRMSRESVNLGPRQLADQEQGSLLQHDCWFHSVSLLCWLPQAGEQRVPSGRPPQLPINVLGFTSPVQPQARAPDYSASSGRPRRPTRRRGSDAAKRPAHSPFVQHHGIRRSRRCEAVRSATRSRW